ncbi:MAG: DUF2937 family protein [Pseudomonadota bacterium]
MLGRILALLLGVAAAIAGSQAPNFTAHFMQNLEGRIDELRMLAGEIRNDRALLGYTDADARAACAETADPLIKTDCERSETILDRYDVLATLQANLKSADGWRRPFILARTVAAESPARDMAENAMVEFQPAVPATTEGAGYAAGSGGLVWGVARLIFGLIGLPFRRRDY